MKIQIIKISGMKQKQYVKGNKYIYQKRGEKLEKEKNLSLKHAEEK